MAHSAHRMRDLARGVWQGGRWPRRVPTPLPAPCNAPAGPCAQIGCRLSAKGCHGAHSYGGRGVPAGCQAASSPPVLSRSAGSCAATISAQRQWVKVCRSEAGEASLAAASWAKAGWVGWHGVEVGGGVEGAQVNCRCASLPPAGLPAGPSRTAPGWCPESPCRLTICDGMCMQHQSAGVCSPQTLGGGGVQARASAGQPQPPLTAL